MAGTRAQRRKHQQRKDRERAQAAASATAKLNAGNPGVSYPPEQPKGDRTKTWAIIGGVVGVLGFFVSIGGVIYTAKATSATQRGVDLQLAQYRPFLVTKDWHPPDPGGANNGEYSWEIANNGPVPAYTQWHGFYRFENDLQHAPTIEELFPATDHALKRTDVDPGQTRLFMETADIAHTETVRWNAVADGRMILYYCIKIDYTGPDRKAEPFVLRNCAKWTKEISRWEYYPPPEVPGERR